MSVRRYLPSPKGNGTSKRGATKGVPIYKTLALNKRQIKAYHFIEQFIKDNGRGPYCFEIGLWLGGSTNHITARNKGIRTIVEPLERQGFIERVGQGRNSYIRLTAKPMTDVTIVIPTDSKARH